MKIVSTIARYLAGAIFVVFGLNGFLHFIPFPPHQGLAGAGVLLLVNRFVPLALAVLAPVIVNILCFHAFMAPSGLPLALFVALLWALTFAAVRPAFASLFQAQTKGVNNAI